MPERRETNQGDPKSLEGNHKEREKRIEDLLEAHRSLNLEWNTLLLDESKLLSESAYDIESLSEIHERRSAIVDKLWDIEQEIIELHG